MLRRRLREPLCSALTVALSLLAASGAVATPGAGSPEETRRTVIAICKPIEIEPPSPYELEKFEPEYPVALWLAGDQEIVAYSVGVDTAGQVTGIDRIQGREPFAGLALAALRRWKYVPARESPTAKVPGSGYASFYFSPLRAVYIEEEARVVPIAPQVLVPVPFVCPPGAPATLGRRSWDLVRVRVEATGFVSDARLLTAASPDSTSILATARMWIFRPFVATDGPRVGRAIPIWAAVQVKRSCQNNGLTNFTRPDSLFLADLGIPWYVRVCAFRPSPREGRTIAGPADFVVGGRGVDTRISSDIVAYREVRADSLVPALRALLLDEMAYRGPTPHASRRLPEPEYGLIVFRNPGSRISLLLSPGADVLHIWDERGMLEVPYGPRRRQFAELLRGLLPPPTP